MYRELLDRWCKANPGFYKSTYSFLGLEECKKAGFSMKEGDYLLAVIYVDRSVNWSCREYEGIKEGKSIEDYCKEELDKIMHNDGFRQYYSLLDFKTIEELEVKLAMQGI